MRVLGIDIQASDVIAVIVDGTHTDAAIEKLEPTRIPFPQVGPDEADNLLLFENQLVAITSQARTECVGIVKAIGGMNHQARRLHRISKRTDARLWSFRESITSLAMIGMCAFGLRLGLGHVCTSFSLAIPLRAGAMVDVARRI